MKKLTSIAFAVAALSAGTAMAQSSVTVYGRLNTSIERQSDFGTPETRYVLANNGSRLGFKGTEDLGGGLKANFILEHRFDIDTGRATNGAFWGGAGTSEVNLASDSAGTIRFGHFTSEAYFATSDATDLLNHGTGTSSDALYKYLGNDDNKISYRTPALGGFTGELGVSLSENTGRGRIFDVAMNYGLGPLGLGFGYENVRNGDTQFAVRASYDFSPVLVTGYIQRYKNKAANASQTIYRVSGQYTMGAGEFHLAYGSQGDLDNNGINDKAKQFTVGYNYNLSKRTKLFAYYSAVKFSEPTFLDPDTIAFGVRHNF